MRRSDLGDSAKDRYARRRLELRAERISQCIEVDGRPFQPWAPHGSEYGYTEWGCRCEVCVAASVASRNARNAARRARLKPEPKPIDPAQLQRVQSALDGFLKRRRARGVPADGIPLSDAGEVNGSEKAA